MGELRKLIVKKASELPNETQKKLGVFGDSLVEIRLSTNSPTLGLSSINKIKGTFSGHLHKLLDQSNLLKD